MYNMAQIQEESRLISLEKKFYSEKEENIHGFEWKLWNFWRGILRI